MSAATRTPAARLRSPALLGSFFLVVWTLQSQDPESRDPAPVEEFRPLSIEEGIAAKSPLLKPGKLDFLYRVSDDVINYNFIAWSPIFKGGGGMTDFDGGQELKYAGGYARPLLPWKEYGELIVGGLVVESDDQQGDEQYDYEIQGEYRLPFGLGGGGGVVEKESDGLDINFGKLTYRNSWREWKYIVEAQVQEYEDEVWGGGYGAVYNEFIMAVYGHDGEQWRTAAALLAPENGGLLRPAIEVLYVDNTVGDFNGARFLFINATLKYKGGFLSHAARLGRAMGPQGLEFGNPLGFLRPTWNRRLDLWELGQVADARVVYTDLPGGVILEKYEALTYPLQYLDDSKNFLDGFFVGGFFMDDSVDDTPGILGGYSGKLLFMKFSAGIEYATETDEVSGVLGVIDTF